MKNNKTLKKILGVLKAIVIVLIVAFVIVVCLQRFSDNKISFFKFRMFTVISGSMKPKYVIGDVLISKEVDASSIKIGDTISYLGESGSFKDKVITHEVIEIEQDQEGKYIFHAKGLANLVEDPVVYEDQLYGKVIYKAIILSTIYRIVATNVGFYLFIILPIMFVIGSEIISMLLEKEEQRRNKNNDDKE